MKKIILAKTSEKRRFRGQILTFHFSLFLFLFSLPLAAEDAGFYNEQGWYYYDEWELDLAIEAFSRAISLEPDWADPWYGRGLAYYDKEELDLAIENFSQAIARDPDWDELWYDRGLAYYDKDELDLAIEDFSQAIALDPDWVAPWYDRGRAYYDKGEFDLAIENFNKAIDLDPNWDEPWYYRGISFYEKGEFDLAIEDFSEAIILNPDWVAPWYDRGRAYYDKAEFDLAIENFSEAIVLDPDWDEPWNKRGNAYLDKGEPVQAIEDLSKAISLNSYNAFYWNERGYAYLYNREYGLAIEDFSKAILLNSNNTVHWNSRAIVYISLGELDLALMDINTAIDLNENDHFAWNSRGNIYRAKGELERAIEAYSRAIAIDPNNAMTLNNRGNAYHTKGEFVMAIEDYSRAIEINPFGEVTSYSNRGMAYSRIGEFDLAMEDYGTAIALNPRNDTAWNNRGMAYLSNRQLDRAIEDFSHAIEINPNSANSFSNRGEAIFLRGVSTAAGDVFSEFFRSQMDLAIEDYSKSLAINPNDPVSWYRRGRAHIMKNEVEQGGDDFWQCIVAAEKSNNILDIFFWAWEFAGHVYSNYPFFQGEMDSMYDLFTANLARAALIRSIARAENARSNMGSRGTQIMSGFLYQYYAAVDFEVNFGTAERAFAFSEGLRSRGFLEQMGTEAALKLPGIDPMDAQRVRDLIRDIDIYRELLLTLDPRTEWDSYAEIGSILTRTEDQLANLDAEITVKVPAYARLRNPRLVDIEEAKSFCGNDRVILKYILWDSSIEFNAPTTSGGGSAFRNRPSINSYCLVITKDSITPVRLDPHFNYAANVDTLRSRLLRGVIDGIAYSETAFEAQRNLLYNALIKPVLEHIPANIKNILIVPDSNLAFLPFDILRENSESPNLGERFSISLSPSVSISILSKQTQIIQNEPIIAFGGVWYRPGDEDRTTEGIDIDSRLAALNRGLEEEETRGMAGGTTRERMRAVDFFNIERHRWRYLEGSTVEVQSLETIATIEPSILLGGEASMHKVKELSLDGSLLNYPIIHFALHGFFRDHLDPQAALVFSEYSGLLADKSEEDGYLSIEDIAPLQLNAKMVMLSACQTGIGSLNRGDGMSGLARAFMVAGAQNVGVSLWDISDRATVDFMLGVYGKVIGQGKSFRDAYSEMKAEFRSSESWSHPYYWAGFTLYE